MPILLIPLDKLIPELAEWLADSDEWVLETRLPLIIDNIKYLNETEPEMLPLFIAQEIYKRHGDLHGLIPRNLAIDKTLNS